MVKISATLAKQLTKRHKYNAQRVACLLGGHDHDSKKEAQWCLKLHELQKEGKITLLCRQPRFELFVNKMPVAVHIPDFSYYVFLMKKKEQDERDGIVTVDCAEVKQCVVEVKGFKTVDWKLKHKLFMALYPDVEYTVV